MSWKAGLLERVLSAEGQADLRRYLPLAGRRAAPLAAGEIERVPSDDDMSEVKQEVRAVLRPGRLASWSARTFTRTLATKTCARSRASTSTTATCAWRGTSSRRAATLLDAGSGRSSTPNTWNIRAATSTGCAPIFRSPRCKEARKRVGEHGLYVVADIANLPFKPDVFDGVVSLHTIHHLPEGEHLRAFDELYRVLAPAARRGGQRLGSLDARWRWPSRSCAWATRCAI